MIPPALEKLASTALVRQILRGALKPETIRRAASEMPVGKFRTVKNLGRGQFSLTDLVVGNVADRKGGTYAGLMARKLPVRRSSPHREYGQQANLIDRLNRRHPILNLLQAPPLARYVHVGPKGAFQELANRRVWYRPRRLTNLLNDLHPGNLGPKGQILDFGIRTDVAPRLRERITPIRDHFRERLIDRASLQGTSPNYDIWGNWDVDQIPKQFRRHRQFSDNLVRRYHALPPSEQGQMLEELSKDLSRRWQEMAPVRKYRINQLRRQAQSAPTASWDHTPIDPTLWERAQPLLLRPVQRLLEAPLPIRLAAAGGISTPLWGPRAWEILRELLTRQPAFGGDQTK